MAKPSETSGRKPEKFQFRADFDGKPDKPIGVVVHAFDPQGELLASAPVTKDGRAELTLTPHQARSARIFFAPAAPADAPARAPLTLRDMERLHAYEPTWKFDPRSRRYELLPIPDALWRWWPWCSCRVRGRVVRPVNINGVVVDKPVCNARVHICEVDRFRWVIWRLPDHLVFRIRDELLRLIEQPIPIPIPLPDPPPFAVEPELGDPSPVNIAAVVKAREAAAAARLAPGAEVMLNPQPLPPGEVGRAAATMSAAAGLTPGADVMLNPQPLPPRVAELSITARATLQSAALPVVRQALVDHASLVLAHICLWDWLRPYFCICDEIRVVTTDGTGRFDTTIWYPCFGDHPDLYFWVEFFIGGVWTTVYSPPVCCYTYWDYACGSDVTIRVTDPRVPWCEAPPDLPGLQVAVMAIGQNVSVHEVQGVAAGAAQGLTTAGQPFGGVLEMRVYFSRSALFARNITHYRWSFRRLTQSDGTTAVADVPHAMERKVIRHYSVIDPTPPDFPLSYVPEPMGPDGAFPGQNLFRIQPIDPPTGGIEWTPIDSHEDLATAFFETQLLGGGLDPDSVAGKYQLILELFKNDGSLVDLTTEGILLKVAAVDAPFGAGTVTTALAGAEHLIIDPGSGHLMGFKMVVHVDNNVCQSQLFPISGVGLTVDAECGFIRYAPGTSAHLSFRAYHPHNYATLSYDTVRGTAIPVPSASAGGGVGAASLNLFNRVGSVFHKDVPVATLLSENTPLGHTPCTKAAFSEMLHVWATATDGWQRCSWLDPAVNPKHAAYALEPL